MCSSAAGQCILHLLPCLCTDVTKVLYVRHPPDFICPWVPCHLSPAVFPKSRLSHPGAPAPDCKAQTCVRAVKPGTPFCFAASSPYLCTNRSKLRPPSCHWRNMHILHDVCSTSMSLNWLALTSMQWQHTLVEQAAVCQTKQKQNKQPGRVGKHRRHVAHTACLKLLRSRGASASQYSHRRIQNGCHATCKAHSLPSLPEGQPLVDPAAVWLSLLVPVAAPAGPAIAVAAAWRSPVAAACAWLGPPGTALPAWVCVPVGPCSDQDAH